MKPRRTVPLAGSELKPFRGARVKGPINGDEKIEVRITLKAPESLGQRAQELANQPLVERQYVSRQEYGKLFATDTETIHKIEQFARDHDLTVTRSNPERHTVHLSGNARDIAQAFQTYLENYELPDGTIYRGRRGPIHVPEDLANVIVTVSGLDQRPVAEPRIRRRSEDVTHQGPSVEYAPEQVASLYSFPKPASAGQGQCIALIELGGGFRQADLNTFFQGKPPQVTAISVDGGSNSPTGNPDSADGEVMLDIEVAGSVAPEAEIAVYFAPNTNKGFLDAISAALHDTTRNPSVISISWGSAEDGGGYSKTVLKAFEQVFQAASVMGVSVLVAAGDNGSGDGLKGNHVDFPASSPWVTACGGTTLVSTDDRTIQSETVWNDGAKGGATGGGMSKLNAVPSWQSNLEATLTQGSSAKLTGRGVPDIAANADPNTGYQILIDGDNEVFGGTSAVAPLVAGLVAIFNQELGKPLGFWNPILYQSLGTSALRDITVGNNGAYAASKGWDACSGVGSPIGSALLSVLKGEISKAAGHQPERGHHPKK